MDKDEAGKMIVAAIQDNTRLVKEMKELSKQLASGEISDTDAKARSKELDRRLSDHLKKVGLAMDACRSMNKKREEQKECNGHS